MPIKIYRVLTAIAVVGVFLALIAITALWESATAASATNVTFTAVQMGGKSGVTDSTHIRITFNSNVTGLTVNNIHIMEDTGHAVKGALAGAGSIYDISLTSVAAEGNVLFSVTDFGNSHVTTTTQSVAVYKNTQGAVINPAHMTYDAALEGYDNSKMPRTFTIKNTWNGPITGLTAKFSGNNFWSGNLPNSATIPVGGSLTFGVRPRNGLAASTLPYTDTITVTGNNGIKQTVPLSFTVYRYGAEINPQNKTYAPAETGYNNTAMDQIFTITNTGTEKITNLAAYLVTEFLDAVFEVKTGLSTTTVNPGGKATICIRPVHGLAAGTYNDLLVVMADNGVELTAELSFTVSNKKITSAAINPETKDYPSAVVGEYNNATLNQIFTIENTGTETITGLSASVDGEYFKVGNLSSLSIAPGGTATVGVRPKNGLLANEATYTDTLRVTGDNGINLSVPLKFIVKDVPVYSVTVDADGNAITEIIFDAKEKGYETDGMVRKVSLTNTGTETIENFAVWTDDRLFALNPGIPTELLQNAVITVDIKPQVNLDVGHWYSTLMIKGDKLGEKGYITLRFTVNKVMVYSAEINPPSKTYRAEVEGYNNATLPQLFTVTNTGTELIENLSASLSGEHYWTGGLSDTKIKPGETVTIGVRPKNGLKADTKPYTDTLTITGDNGIQLSVELSFTVSAAPIYAASADPVNKVFPTAMEGYKNGSLKQVFTVHNTGTGLIFGLNVLFDHGEGSFFEISQSLSANTIEPGGFVTFAVRPKKGLSINGAGTPYNDVVRVTGGNGINIGIPLTFSVSGEPVYAATIDPDYIEFMSVKTGYNHSSMMKVLTVKNIGAEKITGLAASLGGADFEIIGEMSLKDSSNPSVMKKTSLGYGESTTIAVRPINGLTGNTVPYADTLTVTSNEGITLSADLSFSVGINYGKVTGGAGEVDHSDLILMLRFFTQPNVGIDLAAADVNSDGKVNMADLILMLRYFIMDGIVLGPQ